MKRHKATSQKLIVYTSNDVYIGSGMIDLVPYHDVVESAVSLVSGSSSCIGSGPVKSIREEIKKSNTVLCVLGHKYGRIDRNSGKSWPEIELDIAQELGKPVLAYIPDESASWPISQVDADRARINGLQNRFREFYNVRFYNSVLNLHEMIINDLENYWQADIAEVTSRGTAALGNVREKQVKVLRLLLSSPGDVANERDLLQRTIDRYNQEFLISQGVFIKLLRWEEMTPQIGPGPQRALNNQFGDYDIFWGVMWNRFGTRTDLARSGTEEEFKIALRSWRRKKKPWIIFYFSDRSALLNTRRELKQREQVLRFKSNLKKLGIVRTYRTLKLFQDLAYEDLKRIVNQSVSNDSKE
jgi:hypothetical protein